ncbi:MAG: TetR/AcrR family transcriptional regulator [Pseudomonadales bacterium]|nr:TetR/AcrR family transcriptional regulator [Pseudomonadales bacterium]
MTLSAPRGKAKEPYHKGISREDVLDAALKVLHESSLDELTLARVARELGVSAPAVYHIFPSKEALLAAVAALGFRHITELYRREERKATDLHSWIRVRGRIYLTFAIEERALHQLMHRFVFSDRYAYPELIAAEDECFRSSVSRIADARDGMAGKFSSTNSFHDFPMSMTIWATFHGLATIIADGHVRNPNRRLIDKMVTEVADVLTKQGNWVYVPPEDTR